MRTVSSNGGTILPWHRGQSGQPSPESVTLTTPPNTTCATEATRAATARARNSFCAPRVGLGCRIKSPRLSLKKTRPRSQSGQSTTARKRASTRRKPPTRSRADPLGSDVGGTRGPALRRYGAPAELTGAWRPNRIRPPRRTLRYLQRLRPRPASSIWQSN